MFCLCVNIYILFVLFIYCMCCLLLWFFLIDFHWCSSFRFCCYVCFCL